MEELGKNVKKHCSKSNECLNHLRTPTDEEAYEVWMN